MKKIASLITVFALCFVVLGCDRSSGGAKSGESSGLSKGDGEVDTSKLKDVSESKAEPDEILAAVSSGAEQIVLSGFDDTVGAVAQRKADSGKVYVVVTASLGNLPEDDKYNVQLGDGAQIATVIGSLTKVGENQYQLKYVGTNDVLQHKSIKVVQVSNKKQIFSGRF